jgi:site-specific DNA recombinase
VAQGVGQVALDHGRIGIRLREFCARLTRTRVRAGEDVVQVAIYARISRDSSGISENIDIQISLCKEYAEDKGWKVVGIFQDNDISASKYSTKRRPGYNTLITALKNDGIEAVLVVEMSRLYRRIEELLDLIRLAETTSLNHIVVIEEGSGYDLSTGIGINDAVSSVNNAVYESRKMSDRLKRKFRARAKGGLAHGGSRPYGYETGGMIIREDEAQVIRRVTARVIRGTSIATIVKDLNDRGIPSASGKKWGHKSLKQVLTRRRLIGIRTHRGVEYPAAWPPILLLEEWEMVQAALRSAYRKRTFGRTYLLTGLLECGSCGKPLLGDAHPNRTGQEPKRRYSCKKGDNYGGYVGCGKVSRLSEPIEIFVCEAMLYRLESEDLAALLAPKTPEVKPLLERYQFLQQRLQELVQDYATGLLNRQQLGQAKSAVETEIDKIQAELTAAQPRQALSVIEAGQTVKDAWDKEGIEWRSNLIGLLVEKVIVHPGYPGRSRWRGFVFDPTKVEIRWRV